MSRDYWLGFATPFALLCLLWIATAIAFWLRWWWMDPNTRLGRGYDHVADVLDDDGTWYQRSQHTHYWPPGTPWWVVRRLEWARIWACHHSRDHRPATPRAEAKGGETHV